MATRHINDLEKQPDDLDPSTVTARDAVHFRRIIAAAEGVGRADRELRDAVRAAREAGDSWLVIGMALGVTKQAAQKPVDRAFHDRPVWPKRLSHRIFHRRQQRATVGTVAACSLSGVLHKVSASDAVLS